MAQKSNAVAVGKAVAENPAVVPDGQDQNIDYRVIKRTLASRLYSERYRIKKLRQRAKLETDVKRFQAELTIKEPRVTYFDTRNSLLRTENGLLKKKLSAYTEELNLKRAEYAELLHERENLKQLEQMQYINQDMVFPFGFP